MPEDKKQIFTIKLIYPLTIFIIILVLTAVMSFLYNNVYLTMAQAGLVSNLKAKVIEESVDFEKFNNIVAKINDRKNSAGRSESQLASPFSYGSRL